ncbi:S8 family peptidase [Candidatus Bealeia paramacronuclearis]|uniref:S8 family peptidase n=1 Tax=Candidatus Bealeia paramacronuclearis TaxID=1921001 RepID=A0ABZ2C399_9PROT|nr:S8 family peptidase [Candidatus Bealeia paramacronuclearis]
MSRLISRIGYILFVVGWLVVIFKNNDLWNHFFAPTPLEVIGAQEAHSKNWRGKDVIVAVLDEGFDLEHLGLKSQTLPYRYNTDDRLPYADTSVIYKNGHYEFQSHGTHVSGIILGNASGKFKGVAPDAKLIPIKIGGRGGEKSLVRGLNLAQKSPAHIVNISMQLSFSGRWISPDVAQALVDLAQSGKITRVTQFAAKGWESKRKT